MGIKVVAQVWRTGVPRLVAWINWSEVETNSRENSRRDPRTSHLNAHDLGTVTSTLLQ